MFHIVAWEESIDPGGALVTINAIREEMLFTSGDDIRVHVSMPNIIGKAATINDASAARAQIQSPSLRVMTNLDVEPVVAALTFGSPPEASFHPQSAIPVVADEALNFAVQSDPVSAVLHRGFVWLADAAQQPIAGQFFSVRATSAIALVTGTWVNGNLVMSQTLPTGRYQVIGMRARGTNLVAARLVFPEQIARPGVLAVNAIGDEDPWSFRRGMAGVWGEFLNTVPPTVDALGTTDTAQTYILDLVRVS